MADSEEFREEFRGTFEGQFDHDFYKKNNCDQVKFYENDTLDQRIDFWLLMVYREGPIPDDIKNYHMDGIFNLRCKAVHPEMKELVKLLQYKKVIP